MLALEFHPLIEADLTAAAKWYEQQEPGLGSRFTVEAHEAFLRLTKDALLFAIRFDDIRRLNLPSFPYGLFYFVEDETVVVIAVLHAARDSKTELKKRRTDYS